MATPHFKEFPLGLRVIIICIIVVLVVASDVGLENPSNRLPLR